MSTFFFFESGNPLHSFTFQADAGKEVFLKEAQILCHFKQQAQDKAGK